MSRNHSETHHLKDANYYKAEAHIVNNLDNTVFYSKVMLWTVLSLIAMVSSMIILGPLVPESWLMPLYIGTLVALFATAAVKKMSPIASNALTIAVPAILGLTIYPSVNYYIGSGQGDIVISAATGALIIFASMGIWGWTSKKDLTGWLPYMFFILIGMIGVSLLNVFLFQLEGIAFIISLIAVPLFAIYTFIDLQLVKTRGLGEDTPASFYALNLFLDIFNLFVALLDILGITSGD